MLFDFWADLGTRRNRFRSTVERVDRKLGCGYVRPAGLRTAVAVYLAFMSIFRSRDISSLPSLYFNHLRFEYRRGAFRGVFRLLSSSPPLQHKRFKTRDSGDDDWGKRLVNADTGQTAVVAKIPTPSVLAGRASQQVSARPLRRRLQGSGIHGVFRTSGEFPA